MGKKHSEVQISSKIGLASLFLCIVAMLLFSFSGGANSGAEILIGLILLLSCVGAAASRTTNCPKNITNDFFEETMV